MGYKAFDLSKLNLSELGVVESLARHAVDSFHQSRREGWGDAADDREAAAIDDFIDAINARIALLQSSDDA